MRRIALTTLVLSWLCTVSFAAEPLKALIIDGQNNHAWAKTTPLLKAALESSGRFVVDVATTPKDKSQWQSFQPDFAKYAVLVSNYNGDLWPEATCKAFEQYVRTGGGLVIVHAADNSFPQWPEYNKMIALGGWGGRNEKSGPMIRFREGKIVRDMSPGSGGTHGARTPFVVETWPEQASHPIMAGLPSKWMHAQDELYARMRGPAENMTILATALSDKATRGTGEVEPILFTIDYGQGRVFHTVLGHDELASKCLGFVVTLQRGTEWAATGKVTIPVPKDFPTADKVSMWEPAK